MTYRMLYSERKAYAAMGPVRQRIHRTVRAAYFAVPDRFMRPLFPVWRMYRRTWPCR